MEQIIRKKASEIQSFYKTFETEEEAMKIANFLNNQAEKTDLTTDYSFVVRSLAESEIKNIEHMNEYLEKDLMNINGGFYITGINSNEKVITGRQKAVNFNSFGIFKNENDDLVFTDLKLNRKSVGRSFDKIYGLHEVGRAQFVLPHPLSKSPTISTLDGKNKIINQVLRKSPNGSQNLYNADYRSIATNLLNHVSDSYFNMTMFGREGDSFSFAYAMSYANRHLTNISGKTTTDIMSMNKIGGTEGMNLGSTGSFTLNKYLIGKSDFMNLFEDDFNKVFYKGAEMTKTEYLEEVTKGMDHFEFNFSRTGELDDVKIISGLGDSRKEVLLNGSITKDVSSRGRFLEMFNDKMSQINQHSKHYENATATIDSLNSVIDQYAKGGYTRDQGVDSLLRVINGSYGADAKYLESFTKDGGILSRENLGLFLDNGYRFNSFLDVNRQSINTENAVTTMSGAIFDALGSLNKYGQRNAQSDAKMSKAIINVAGQDFNLSEEAKMWSSNIEEYQYKKIHFENGHGKKLIEDAQKILYGKKLNSEYMSQQNYMLYAYHNGAFQDSNIIATDLALENISKYDRKNTMMIPFGAMTNKVTGGEVLDYTKLSSDNVYIDGTMENKMFRAMVGETIYKQHLTSRETLIDDYRSIGRHMQGVDNLQSIDSRRAYATANNNMLGGVNEFLSKHMIASDAKARVKLIADDAVNPGQFKHLTGVNHAYIDGVEFTNKGMLIKTTGIITNGDSTKGMANEVKFTVGSIMPSLGIVNGDGYIPVSGLNNEKILSKKRGFTGTLLERSLNTLAFNHMTLGNGDSFDENFNVWKKAMSEQYVVPGANGKNVNIFDALGIDMTYENGTMKFTNNITNEVLAGYNYRSKGLNSSVNQGIHEHIARRVKENFGFSLNDKTGTDFTEKLFTILAKAEDGLKNTITGNKGSLTESQRRNLASIFVKGDLEAINISGGKAIDSNLGAVKGLRLINNIHIMQETKSRADKEGLSMGRLSTLVLRESGMFELADTIEEKISFDNRKSMEKYLALSGAINDYSDSSIEGTKAHSIFSKNIVDLNDKTIRYNIFGTNTTVNNYLKVSPFGDIIKAHYNADEGALNDLVYGKIVGFSNDFLDVAGELSGDKRDKYISNSLKSIAFSDFAGTVGLDRNDEIGIKKAIIDRLKSEDISKNFSNLSLKVDQDLAIESGIAGSRAKMLKDLVSDGRIGHGRILKDIGLEGNFKKDELVGLLDFFIGGIESNQISDRATLSGISELIGNNKFEVKTNIKNVRSLFNFLNKYSDVARSTAVGEFSSNTNSYHMLEGVKDLALDGKTKNGSDRILKMLFEDSMNDSFNSEYNVSKMLLNRYTDYTGKNVFNLNELNKLSKNNSFNFLIDELSADETGVIISKTSLTEIEKLVKLNKDLEEIDLSLDVASGDKRAKTINSFKKKINDIRGSINSEDKLKQIFPELDSKDLKVRMEAIENIINDTYSVSDDLLKGSYYDLDTIKKMALEDKISMSLGMEFENGIKSALGTDADKKISEIRKLKAESFEILKRNLSDVKANAIRLPNNVVGLANGESEQLKAYGKVFDTFYNKLESGAIKDMFSLNKEIESINSVIKATKGSNIYNDQLNNMLSERDIIRRAVNLSVDNFLTNAVDFNSDVLKSYDSVLGAMEEINSKDLNSANILDSIFKIDSDVRLASKAKNSGDLAVLGLGFKNLRKASKSFDRTSDLSSQKSRIIDQIISATTKVHSELGENFFRKAGALEKMTTTRFKTSVEFSPKEGTIITDYIMAELDSVLKDGSSKSKGEFFSSLRTLYGDAVVDDMHSDFERSFKRKKIESFKIELKNRLENLSGVVLGDHDAFKNAGLSDVIGDSSDTVIRYGMLSRNPHQYQGSLRSTRYVALSAEDRNKSFFGRMLGDKNVMAETQGNLFLVGKRTAIAAHGDHDGDKFQALMMNAKDFYFKGKEDAKSFITRQDNLFRLYQLAADYEGNLERSIKKGNLNNVEKEILSLGRKAFGMKEDAYGRTVYKKIENILYSQKIERIRTQNEVLGENVSHAELSFYNLLKSKKTAGVDEFAKVYGELDDQTKLLFLTNKMTVDDLKDFEKFFDPKMLNDQEFMKKVNKIKAVADEKDIALKVLEEFGENFGAKGKIAWNNATLAESSYAAYTGIARTGTVHYALTNLRDSAVTLWAKDTRAIIDESLDTLGDKALKNSINGMIDSYTQTGLFITPANTIDELIDKLAISSKISDGSNPYSKLKSFDRLADNIYNGIFDIAYEKKEDINKFIKFDQIEKLSKFLIDNESENFDIEKFRKSTGMNSFFDVFDNSFDPKNSIITFISNSLKTDLVDDTISFRGNNNKAILQSFANVYALMGKGMLGTAASARNVSAGINEAVSNPYGGMKTKVYQKGQNFFHGMNMVFNRTIGEDGYNLNTRIFKKFREIFGPKEERINKVAAEQTEEVVNNIVNQGVAPNTTPVAFPEQKWEQTSLDFTQSSSQQIEKEIINDDSKIVTNLEARIAELENQLRNSQAPIIEDSGRIDEIVSQYEEKLHNIQEGSKTNSQFLADKIEELEKEIQSKNIEIEKMNRQHGNAIDNINSVHSKNTDYNSTKTARELEKLNRQHEQKIKNLNEAHEKNSEFTKKKIQDLQNEVERLKVKIAKDVETIKDLSQENKTIRETLSSSTTHTRTMRESVDTLYNNAKSLYNKHTKIAIGAGIGVILGTAISMLQKNRPVVDLDIDEDQYEKSQGSIYRNLGNYNINTNIRSIR